MLTSEEEIKIRLFECIAANSSDLCETGKFMRPERVAEYVQHVYDMLFSNKSED